jgi:hypothetical protein
MHTLLTTSLSHDMCKWRSANVMMTGFPGQPSVTLFKVHTSIDDQRQLAPSVDSHYGICG